MSRNPYNRFRRIRISHHLSWRRQLCRQTPRSDQWTACAYPWNRWRQLDYYGFALRCADYHLPVWWMALTDRITCNRHSYSRKRKQRRQGWDQCKNRRFSVNASFSKVSLPLWEFWRNFGKSANGYYNYSTNGIECQWRPSTLDGNVEICYIIAI